MRLRRLAMLAPLVVTAVMVEPTLVATASPGGDRVVARVGNATITVHEYEERLKKVPPFQLTTYGKTPEEIKRTFLEKVVIPELLLASGAQARGKAQDEKVKLRERDLLKSALLVKFRDEMAKPEEISPAELKDYYDKNQDRYRTPARFAIWRILVASLDQAQQILTAAKKDPTPKTWSELARSKSLDKATNMRGGNLGFVTEDGVSTNKKVRVDKALVEAVKGVKDGEFAPEPVKEGSGYAVVWRRGSMPAVNRTLREEESTIRKILARDRALEGQKKLLEELRTKHLGEVNDKAVSLITVTSTGKLIPESKPGRIERRPGRGAPKPGSRGLR